MDFADFWKLYPRKVAKKDAAKAWSKLTEAQQEKAIKAVPLHVKCWCVECRQPHLIPHPATWLNGERFEDEISAQPLPSLEELAEAKGMQARPGESTEQYHRRILQAMH